MSMKILKGSLVQLLVKFGVYTNYNADLYFNQITF